MVKVQKMPVLAQAPEVLVLVEPDEHTTLEHVKPPTDTTIPVIRYWGTE